MGALSDHGEPASVHRSYTSLSSPGPRNHSSFLLLDSGEVIGRETVERERAGKVREYTHNSDTFWLVPTIILYVTSTPLECNYFC